MRRTPCATQMTIPAQTIALSQCYQHEATLSYACTKGGGTRSHKRSKSASFSAPHTRIIFDWLPRPAPPPQRPGPWSTQQQLNTAAPHQLWPVWRYKGSTTQRPVSVTKRSGPGPQGSPAVDNVGLQAALGVIDRVVDLRPLASHPVLVFIGRRRSGARRLLLGAGAAVQRAATGWHASGWHAASQRVASTATA